MGIVAYVLSMFVLVLAIAVFAWTLAGRMTFKVWPRYDRLFKLAEYKEHLCGRIRDGEVTPDEAIERLHAYSGGLCVVGVPFYMSPAGEYIDDFYEAYRATKPTLEQAFAEAVFGGVNNKDAQA